MNLDDDTTDDTPLGELLPALTLDDVRDGREPDPEIASYLLGNLAALVPARE
ncbi:hypothetical protein AB0J38_25955 [Streptomyces sp. NPDC050095]|uniref:hypothetical protein n=1 Tax=unclassified Streptomyces TaxID=2593676 RepID=UPI00343AACC8